MVSPTDYICDVSRLHLITRVVSVSETLTDTFHATLSSNLCVYCRTWNDPVNWTTRRTASFWCFLLHADILRTVCIETMLYPPKDLY